MRTIILLYVALVIIFATLDFSVHSFPFSQTRLTTGIPAKFLHITDIHIDPYYRPYTSPAFSCHRRSLNSPNTALPYGTVGTPCDTPLLTANATFNFLHEQSPVQFVVYTGDSVRHDRDKLMERTKAEVEEGNKMVVQWFVDEFVKNGIAVIPTIGNNDVYEHDFLPPGPTPFLNTLFHIWKPLNLNLTSSFLRGGYFRHDLPDSPLTFISMNSLYLYKVNGLVGDCTEGTIGWEMLRWMTGEMRDLKGKERRVAILQHVPPFDATGRIAYFPKCYEMYVDILGRYSDIIIGHFAGHTNDDTIAFVTESSEGYKMYPVVKEEKPANNSNKNVVLVLNNAPSVVPANNPGLRIYHYATSPHNYGHLLDYVQYYVNMTQAHLVDSFEYEIEYTARDAYGLESLEPKEWMKLLREFEQDDSEAWKKYCLYQTVSETDG